MKTCVKICGITNLPDAYCAAKAGADLIGFIFYPQSVRYIQPALASDIVQVIQTEFGVASPRFVGVFVNEPVAQVSRVIELVGLDLVQLHGHEPLSEVELLAPYAFKAIRPETLPEAESALDCFQSGFIEDINVPQLLVDAYHPHLYGGTGTQTSIEIARSLALHCRLLLAGGLTLENIAEIVAQVRPWGVDVSSGVDAHKPKKDHHKITAFIRAVHDVKP